jgi:hypothetical protein
MTSIQLLKEKDEMSKRLVERNSKGIFIPSEDIYSGLCSRYSSEEKIEFNLYERNNGIRHQFSSY